jgi:hypothetical protein
MERNNKRKCRKKRERGGNIKHSLYPSWKIVLVNVCSIGILFIDNGYKSSFITSIFGIANRTGR